MAGQMSKHKINIGLTSLILIFIILCLATFSLLSLSSARGDQSLAARSARAVTEYYRADAEGEKWLKQGRCHFAERDDEKSNGPGRDPGSCKENGVGTWL